MRLDRTTGAHPIGSRLKRYIRPLEPIYGPIWGRLRPYVVRGRPRIRRAPEARLRILRDKVAQALGGRTPAIRPIRTGEFVAVAQRFPYYKGRWEYMSAACVLAGDIIDRYRAETALELGAHLRPVIVGADVMDLDERSKDALKGAGRVIVQDATKTPWQIADKQYDLFVALQVFEHLGTRQDEAFREVCRIARHAIISLPIDWEMSDPTNCHHRISNERALSWFLPVVPTRIELGNSGHKKRLIYVFENLPMPAAASQAPLAEAV